MKRLEHPRALRRAEKLCAQLGPGCHKIAVAGSIRRGVAKVKDIELVAIPRMGVDLFGEPTGQDELIRCLRKQVAAGELAWRQSDGCVGKEPTTIAGGKFYRLVTCDDMPVDLFVVRPPAQWGAIFAIRTGPADYARKLVTRAREHRLQCRDGRLVSLADGSPRQTVTERAFVEACGFPYVSPRDRF